MKSKSEYRTTNRNQERGQIGLLIPIISSSGNSQILVFHNRCGGEETLEQCLVFQDGRRLDLKEDKRKNY